MAAVSVPQPHAVYGAPPHAVAASPTLAALPAGGARSPPWTLLHHPHLRRSRTATQERARAHARLLQESGRLTTSPQQQQALLSDVSFRDLDNGRKRRGFVLDTRGGVAAAAAAAAAPRLPRLFEEKPAGAVSKTAVGTGGGDKGGPHKAPSVLLRHRGVGRRVAVAALAHLRDAKRTRTRPIHAGRVGSAGRRAEAIGRVLEAAGIDGGGGGGSSGGGGGLRHLAVDPEAFATSEDVAALAALIATHPTLTSLEVPADAALAPCAVRALCKAVDENKRVVRFAYTGGDGGAEAANDDAAAASAAQPLPPGIAELEALAARNAALRQRRAERKSARAERRLRATCDRIRLESHALLLVHEAAQRAALGREEAAGRRAMRDGRQRALRLCRLHEARRRHREAAAAERAAACAEEEAARAGVDEAFRGSFAACLEACESLGRAACREEEALATKTVRTVRRMQQGRYLDMQKRRLLREQQRRQQAAGEEEAARAAEREAEEAARSAAVAEEAEARAEAATREETRVRAAEAEQRRRRRLQMIAAAEAEAERQRLREEAEASERKRLRERQRREKAEEDGRRPVVRAREQQMAALREWRGLALRVVQARDRVRAAVRGYARVVRDVAFRASFASVSAYDAQEAAEGGGGGGSCSTRAATPNTPGAAATAAEEPLPADGVVFHGAGRDCLQVFPRASFEVRLAGAASLQDVSEAFDKLHACAAAAGRAADDAAAAFEALAGEAHKEVRQDFAGFVVCVPAAYGLPAAHALEALQLPLRAVVTLAMRDSGGGEAPPPPPPEGLSEAIDLALSEEDFPAGAVRVRRVSAHCIEVSLDAVSRCTPSTLTQIVRGMTYACRLAGGSGDPPPLRRTFVASISAAYPALGGGGFCSETDADFFCGEQEVQVAHEVCIMSLTPYVRASAAGCEGSPYHAGGFSEGKVLADAFSFSGEASVAAASGRCVQAAFFAGTTVDVSVLNGTPSDELSFHSIKADKDDGLRAIRMRRIDDSVDEAPPEVGPIMSIAVCGVRCLDVLDGVALPHAGGDGGAGPRTGRLLASSAAETAAGASAAAASSARRDNPPRLRFRLVAPMTSELVAYLLGRLRYQNYALPAESVEKVVQVVVTDARRFRSVATGLFTAHGRRSDIALKTTPNPQHFRAACTASFAANPTLAPYLPTPAARLMRIALDAALRGDDAGTICGGEVTVSLTRGAFAGDCLTVPDAASAAAAAATAGAAGVHAANHLVVLGPQSPADREVGRHPVVFRGRTVGMLQKVTHRAAAGEGVDVAGGDGDGAAAASPVGEAATVRNLLRGMPAFVTRRPSCSADDDVVTLKLLLHTTPEGDALPSPKGREGLGSRERAADALRTGGGGGGGGGGSQPPSSAAKYIMSFLQSVCFSSREHTPTCGWREVECHVLLQLRQGAPRSPPRDATSASLRSGGGGGGGGGRRPTKAGSVAAGAAPATASGGGDSPEHEREGKAEEGSEQPAEKEKEEAYVHDYVSAKSEVRVTPAVLTCSEDHALDVTKGPSQQPTRIPKLDIAVGELGPATLSRVLVQLEVVSAPSETDVLGLQQPAAGDSTADLRVYKQSKLRGIPISEPDLEEEPRHLFPAEETMSEAHFVFLSERLLGAYFLSGRRLVLRASKTAARKEVLLLLRNLSYQSVSTDIHPATTYLRTTLTDSQGGLSSCVLVNALFFIEHTFFPLHPPFPPQQTEVSVYSNTHTQVLCTATKLRYC